MGASPLVAAAGAVVVYGILLPRTVSVVVFLERKDRLAGGVYRPRCSPEVLTMKILSCVISISVLCCLVGLSPLLSLGSFVDAWNNVPSSVLRTLGMTHLSASLSRETEGPLEVVVVVVARHRCRTCRGEADNL